MTRSLLSPITTSGHRVRFAETWREEFFEVPIKSLDHLIAKRECRRSARRRLIGCAAGRPAASSAVSAREHVVSRKTSIEINVASLSCSLSRSRQPHERKHKHDRPHISLLIWFSKRPEVHLGRDLPWGRFRFAVLPTLSGSDHQTVGNAAPPYSGNGSGRPKRSQRAARTLSSVNCGTT